MTKPPHPLPYFGSKRRHAPKLAPFIKDRTETLYEPFAGSLAITLYSASCNQAKRYVVGDIHEPLCRLWLAIINEPERTALGYKAIWEAHNDLDYFLTIRDRYNASRDPTDLLWLITASKYNAPRFSSGGNYLQTEEQGYKPKRPDLMEKQILLASHLLKGRTEVRVGDWQTTCGDATKLDFIFLDPPYQGIHADYANRLDRETFINGIENLTQRLISLAITYDGATRGTAYEPLPQHLNLTRIFLASKTKSGRRPEGMTYIESLYVWPPRKDWQHQVISV